jgi:invasion protein IalB
MQTDLYTKAVLTVIALALSAIALQNAIPSAFAQNKKEPVKVIVCDPISWEVNCAEVSYGAIKVGR